MNYIVNKDPCNVYEDPRNTDSDTQKILSTEHRQSFYFILFYFFIFQNTDFDTDFGINMPACKI